MKNYTRKQTEFKGFKNTGTKEFKAKVIDFKKSKVRAYYAGDVLYVISKNEEHFPIPKNSYYLKNENEELILNEKQFKAIFG